MMESVATFLALQCHGRGNKRERAAMIAIGANSGCIFAGRGGGRQSKWRPYLLWDSWYLERSRRAWQRTKDGERPLSSITN